MSDEDTKFEIGVLKKVIHHFSQCVAENAHSSLNDDVIIIFYFFKISK